MKALPALGVVLLAAGLVLFVATVERSPWVLLTPVLVLVGGWMATEPLGATVRAYTVDELLDEL